MTARGFYGPPIRYEGPTIYLQRDRLGRPTSRIFWLSWGQPMFSSLFYLLWNGYHWSSQAGEEVRVLILRNDRWELDNLQAKSNSFLGERSTFGPGDYLQFYERVSARAGLGV